MNTTHQEMQTQRKDPGREVEMAQDRPVFSPATDIYEKGDSILVICDMPGVDEKHVDVTLEDGVLTLTGHTQEEPAPAGQALVHREYLAGVYRRSFQLSSDMDEAKIKATMKNGVLNLLLPKAEKAQPRKIQVEAAG